MNSLPPLMTPEQRQLWDRAAAQWLNENMTIAHAQLWFLLGWLAREQAR